MRDPIVLTLKIDGPDSVVTAFEDSAVALVNTRADEKRNHARFHGCEHSNSDVPGNRKFEISIGVQTQEDGQRFIKKLNRKPVTAKTLG